MIQRVIFIATLLLVVSCETPYTQICEKERPKGKLPHLCVEYCKIADQGCNPGLWEWKDQNGCTEEQEVQYIEMRRYALQLCQGYLEICTNEDGTTPLEDASCIAFCQDIHDGPNIADTTTNNDLYESNLKLCREERDRHANQLPDETEEPLENNGIPLNSNIADSDTNRHKIEDHETELRADHQQQQQQQPTTPTNNIHVKKNRPTEIVMEKDISCYCPQRTTCHIEIITLLVIFCIMLCILLWDNRRSFTQLKLQMAIQYELLKRHNEILEKKKK